MSEQEKPKSFMQELDEWSMAKVIDPLHDETTCQILDCGLVVERVKKAIRTKVLESYRNGLAVGRREAGGPARPEYPRGKGISKRRK